MINTIKASLLKLIKSKRINVFFLFLALSFIILLFTKLSKDYTNTIIFKVKKSNVPKQHIILKDTSLKLKVTLKTHGFKWLKYYLEAPKIDIDFLNDVKKNKGYYIWQAATSKLFLSNQLGEQVQVVNATPDTLFFNYDTNMVKRVPVNLKADIKFMPGFNTATPITLKPDSIEVVGPHSIVSKIDVIDTHVLKLNELKTSVTQSLNLQLPPHSSNVSFSNKAVVITAQVKKFTEGTLKVPIRLINTPKNIVVKFFPKWIHVKYYTSLDNFKNITTKDFVVQCDFNKVKDGQSFLMPELVKTPKDVKYAKINQKHIEFIILK